MFVRPRPTTFSPLFSAIAENPTVALNNCEWLRVRLVEQRSSVCKPDLQGKGRLTALTWEHKSEGPRHDPVWTSHCKGKPLCHDWSLSEVNLTSCAVDGVEVSTGTGKTQNLAKEAAAEKAKTILEAQDQAAQNSESAT